MKILVAIHGSHSRPEQMRAQRETWLQDAVARGLDYKFFLGDPAIEAEDVAHVQHPDGPRFLDAKRMYRTWILNRKTEALAEYALECGYDYVFKCDDDTCARVPQLLNSGFEQHDYSGFTEPHFAFGFGAYRWAQGGAGYWLARRAMEIIDEHGLTSIPAEDFAVGQLLARHGIHPHHDDRYTPVRDPKEADWITLHKIAPEAMRQIHATV